MNSIIVEPHMSAAAAPNPLFAIPLLNRARDQYAKGQYEATIASCHEALAFNPNLQTIYSCRGSCYFELKNYDAALADQNRAIELQPDSAQAYCDQGPTHITLEQPQNAFANYNRAVELKSNLIEARVGRSWAQLQLKEYESIIADCDYVLKRNPDLLDVYGFRAAAYQGLNNIAGMLKDLNYNVNVQLITDRHNAKAWVSKSTLLSNSCEGAGHRLRKPGRKLPSANQLSSRLRFLNPLFTIWSLIASL